jgi:hypothetical protein
MLTHHASLIAHDQSPRAPRFSYAPRTIAGRQPFGMVLTLSRHLSDTRG